MAFIGFEEDFEQYQKQQDQKLSEQNTSEINVIAYESIEPISDEDLLLLLNTRNRNDASMIYMQSDLSFYDAFYNNDELDRDPIMEQIRDIRRLYKNIDDYEEAVLIRATYIEHLIEKNGGPERFNILFRGGKLKDWIPPAPILSDKAPGYYEYMNDIEVYTEDEEKMQALADATDEMVAQAVYENIVIRGDVELRRDVNEFIDSLTKEGSSIRYSSNSQINNVSVNDLYGLQQMFDSWYSTDKKSNNKPEEVEMFTKTEAYRRKKYYSETPVIVEEGTFTKYVEDPDSRYTPVTRPNPNEMVVDQKTNLPMTRGELRKRKLIRHLGELGWDSVKLMRRMYVGSDYELNLLKRKQYRNKKAKKKAASMMSEMLGESNPSTVATISDLQNLLFNTD